MQIVTVYVNRTGDARTSTGLELAEVNQLMKNGKDRYFFLLDGEVTEARAVELLLGCTHRVLLTNELFLKMVDAHYRLSVTVFPDQASTWILQ